jgi:hypothetical protein
MLFLLLLIVSCSGGNMNVNSTPNLIKEGFISDTEYEIVCLGIPKTGLSGIQKEESAKRAALLSAYFYVKNRFDDSVIPDKDGKVSKFVMHDDHGELSYIVKKPGLKKRIKK